MNRIPLHGRSYGRVQNDRARRRIQAMLDGPWRLYHVRNLQDPNYVAKRSTVRGTCNRYCGCKPNREHHGDPIAEQRLAPDLAECAA